jgi:hypothetical protein
MQLFRGVLRYARTFEDVLLVSHRPREGNGIQARQVRRRLRRGWIIVHPTGSLSVIAASETLLHERRASLCRGQRSQFAGILPETRPRPINYSRQIMSSQICDAP